MIIRIEQQPKEDKERCKEDQMIRKMWIRQENDELTLNLCETKGTNSEFSRIKWRHRLGLPNP